MKQKIRKIGWEKASLFNKNFDKIYDYWKNKALEDHNNNDILLIKEHNKVLIYIIVEDIDQFTERPDWDDTELTYE